MSIESILRVQSFVEYGFFFVQPSAHKRKPSSCMFKIKLREQWIPVVQRFLELGEHTLAFAANALPAQGVCLLAF